MVQDDFRAIPPYFKEHFPVTFIGSHTFGHKYQFQFWMPVQYPQKTWNSRSLSLNSS